MQTIIAPQVKREISEIIDKRVEERHIPPLKTEFHNLRGDIHSLKGDVHTLKGDFHNLKGEVHNLREDFSELKKIVENLGITVGELALAQKRTEIEIQKLTVAIEKTRTDLQGAIDKTRTDLRTELGEAIDKVRTELGGLSRSVSYSLENEAYKTLPAYLKENLGIEITKRFVRTTIEGEEINLFGIGSRNGSPIVIVGEAELKLSSISRFRQLERKVRAVQKKYKEDIVEILITHYATPHVLEKAKEKDIIIIQSFEWQ